jgi:chaperonin cofactor prefoldin
MINVTLELHSLKELIILRKTIQERMNYLEEAQDSLTYIRQNTTEYLTLGQILVRLPEPSTLTPQVCTEEDINLQEDTWNKRNLI